MAGRPDPVTSSRRPRAVREWFGGRELLMGAAALGLVFGLFWADERWACSRLDDQGDALVERDASLEEFAAQRCEDTSCEQIEIVSSSGCVAKIELQAARLDDYGEELGTFITVEGLSYSPLFDRWRVREILDDKQILGLPVP